MCRNCFSDCGRQYMSVRITGGRLTATFTLISLDELVPSASRRDTNFGKCPKNTSKLSPPLLVRPDRSKDSLWVTLCFLTSSTLNVNLFCLLPFCSPQLTYMKQPLRLSTNQQPGINYNQPVRPSATNPMQCGSGKGTRYDWVKERACREFVEHCQLQNVSAAWN